MVKEVKKTDFLACFLPCLFHRLSDILLETEMQMFSVQKALSAVYSLHLLKDSLYPHVFIFRNMNTHTHTMAAEAAPLDTVSGSR